MKKQIEFDFSKWGQEGISVEINGNPVRTIHKNIDVNDVYYGCYENSINVFSLFSNNLQMYQEVKPREFFLVEYPDGLTEYHYNSFKDADERKHEKAIRIVKFVEVIEEN